MESVLTKSPEAFRTIGEVAEELDVPQHVLRFWEAKFPHIRPVKRGGGRRYYRPQDIELLRTIQQLLHNNGYTIKGVQKLLRENGPGALRHSVGVILVSDEAEHPPSGHPQKAMGKGNGRNLPSDGQQPAAPASSELVAIIQELELLRRTLAAG